MKEKLASLAFENQSDYDGAQSSRSYYNQDSNRASSAMNNYNNSNYF